MNLPSTNPSLPPSPPPSPLNIFPFVKGECCSCNVKDRWLLHNVVFRGVDRRICTSCVLRLNPSSFCPICFEFYETPLSITSSSSSSRRFISCVKCSSKSHIHCLQSPTNSSFICPPCSKPNFTFFPVPESMVDEKFAQAFLCANKIASALMKKQTNLSIIRNDRAVKEAAIARKRAKEAIEHGFALESLKGSIGLTSNNMIECKKEEFNGFGGEHPQCHNVPLSNKIGTNGIDGRLGNNGGRFGAAFKTSAF